MDVGPVETSGVVGQRTVWTTTPCEPRARTTQTGGGAGVVAAGCESRADESGQLATIAPSCLATTAHLGPERTGEVLGAGATLDVPVAPDRHGADDDETGGAAGTDDDAPRGVTGTDDVATGGAAGTEDGGADGS